MCKARMARQDRKTIGLIALPPAASRQRAERSSTGTEDSWEMKLTASEPDFILKGCEPRTSSATALESAILPSPWCQCVSMPPGGTLPLADGVAAATRCRTAPPARPGCLRPPTVRRRRRDFVRVVVRAQDDDVRRLERLFHEVSGGEDDTSCRHELVDGQTVFHNLPLWRVQWAAAPGMVQVSTALPSARTGHRDAQRPASRMQPSMLFATLYALRCRSWCTRMYRTTSTCSGRCSPSPSPGDFATSISRGAQRTSISKSMASNPGPPRLSWGC